ncbi:MAG: RHS repeat-associated core domain-containing protein [Pseudomonadota bacterium]
MKQNLTYSYDPAGNITAIADAVTPARNQRFAYDDLNRLTTANGVYGAYGYSYDLSGNRIAQSRPAANDAYSIALSSNRLLQISGGTIRSFTYDAAGHAANDNRGPGANYSYTYDSAGDMAQADRDGLTLARYTSGARHLRAIRDLPGASVPKTHYLYDASGNLLAEHDGVSGAVLREVIWLPPTPESFGGRGPAMDAGAALPLGWVDATASGAPLYAVHAGHLGTPQKLTDAAGAIAWDGVFAPFGETHAITGTLAQNLRFPGQYADSESGLSWNWHRTYDPSLGRYLQSDPIGLAGGINTYAYVNGNPVRYTDPQGLFVPALAAGAAISPEAAAGALALSAGALAILNEILDGADDPADKAKADAQKAKEKCEKDCDQQYYEVDTPTCNAISKKRGKITGARCHASASQRYAACLRGQPLPPLDTWNN